MASSIERFLIKRTPVLTVDEQFDGKWSKSKPRRKRGDREDKSASKKLKKQPSVEELRIVKIENHLLWTTKYKPNHIGEMIGSREKFSEIKRYVENWISGDANEAILIIGPPGVGKTCLVYAIAKELQYKIFEVNCGLSEKIVCTTDKLRDTIQSHQVCLNDTPKLTSLWGTPSLNDSGEGAELSLSSNSLILFDDIDFMISNEVNGFWKALQNLVQESKKPVILTASRYCELIENSIYRLKIFEIEPPKPEEIVKYLNSIAAKESFSNQLLTNYVDTFNGDVRRTLNEHQYNGQSSTEPLEIVPALSPMEVTIDETPSLIKRYDLLCLQDLVTTQAGILEPDKTRSYFLEGRDIPFDQMNDCRQMVDEVTETIENLTNSLFGVQSKRESRRKEQDFAKFNTKLNDAVKKHGRFLTRQTIATEFFPYLSLIITHQSSRRYATRASRTAKVPIGAVDPFLIKFSVIE